MESTEDRPKRAFWGISIGGRPLDLEVDPGVPQRHKRRRRVVWGVLLIAAGLAFLFVQMGAVDLRDWQPWWPAILFVIGLMTMATAEVPRQIASGVSWILWGLWFFACTHHWYGLTYRTAWPLIVVIVGFEMVLAALLDSTRVRRGEHHG